jgi:small subunit ribosomal protein S21
MSIEEPETFADENVGRRPGPDRHGDDSDHFDDGRDDLRGEDGDRRRPRRRADAYGEAVFCRPLEVLVKDDRIEQAIRQLKNRLAREGVLRELKNRRHYFKPSELKRIKRREAARRRRKQARQRPRK